MATLSSFHDHNLHSFGGDNTRPKISSAVEVFANVVDEFHLTKFMVDLSLITRFSGLKENFFFIDSGTEHIIVSTFHVVETLGWTPVTFKDLLDFLVKHFVCGQPLDFCELLFSSYHLRFSF